MPPQALRSAMLDGFGVVYIEQLVARSIVIWFGGADRATTKRDPHCLLLTSAIAQATEPLTEWRCISL